MFINVGLIIEMYFIYIFKRKWVFGNIFFFSKLYWYREKNI